MNTIAALLDAPSLPKGSHGGNATADGGLFAEALNRQMERAPAPQEPPRAEPSPRNEPTRAEKRTSEPAAAPTNAEEPTRAEGGQERADGEDTHEAGTGNQGEGAPSAEKKAKTADTPADPAVVPPSQWIAELVQRQVATEAGEALPADGDGLPVEPQLPGTLLTGSKLARELGLRSFDGATPEVETDVEMSAEAALPDSGEAVGATPQEGGGRSFDRLLDGVRLAMLRAAGGGQANAGDQAAVKGATATELAPELMTTGTPAKTDSSPAAAGPLTGVSSGTATATTASAPTQAAQQLSVQVPVRQNGWDEAFAQRVTWAARQGIQEAQVQLNPRELGPVEVRITMHNDQANISFVAAHQTTRDALESAMPRLREMLNDAGINLAQGDVSSQSFAQREQAAAGEGGAGNRGGNGGESVIDDGAEMHESTIRAGNGVLDYYA